MARTQAERISVVETKITQLQTDVADIKDNLADNHEDLAKRLDMITEKLNGKLDDHEKRISVTEETLEPFTRFRRRLWGMIVTALLTLAVAAIILLETQRYRG